MEGRAQDAIGKLTVAMSRLDENQQAFQKEDDYKAMAEALKAAYDILKDLKPTAGVTSGPDEMRRRAAGLEQDVRNGTRTLASLAALLDNRSEADDDMDDDDLDLIARNNEACAVVRAMYNLFSAYPNGMMYQETAAANPFLVKQLVQRMNVQRMMDYEVAKAAVVALTEMVDDCPAAKKQFFDQEGLKWLIDMLDDDEGGNENISAVSQLLSALASDDAVSRATIGQRTDIFDALVLAFCHLNHDNGVKDEIAKALFHLSFENAANQRALRKAGATAALACQLADETLEEDPDNNLARALSNFARVPLAEMEE
jgi:hypothetical protein